MNMKMLAVSLLIVFLGSTADVFAEMGYRKDPWGGKTWTGPGAPPHWSPEAQHRYNRMKKGGYVKPNVRLPYWHDDATPGHPGHHSHYYHVNPHYKKHYRGSHIYIYVGPGGYYISATGKWGWHDKRRRGYVYYSQPIYSTQYIIVERNPYSRENESQSRPEQPREGFTPLTPKEKRCSDKPTIRYGEGGSLYMSTGSVPADCVQ